MQQGNFYKFFKESDYANFMLFSVKKHKNLFEHMC